MDGKLHTTPSRIMWMITYGEIPFGQYVVTTCEVRHCVNPAHLKMEAATKLIDSLEAKFWKRVIKTDGCWLWTGALDNCGYGQIHLGMGKHCRAHRASWEIHNGGIAGGLDVLHHYDNPPCTRPDHLFLGTQADNVADMDKKGRRVNAPLLGMKHWRSKITDDDVRSMRSLKASGVSTGEIAEQFNINRSHAWWIVAGRGWRHIA